MSIPISKNKLLQRLADCFSGFSSEAADNLSDSPIESTAFS